MRLQRETQKGKTLKSLAQQMEPTTKMSVIHNNSQNP